MWGRITPQRQHQQNNATATTNTTTETANVAARTIARTITIANKETQEMILCLKNF
jgi:hypothetical protein